MKLAISHSMNMYGALKRCLYMMIMIALHFKNWHSDVALWFLGFKNLRCFRDGIFDFDLRFFAFLAPLSDGRFILQFFLLICFQIITLAVCIILDLALFFLSQAVKVFD